MFERGVRVILLSMYFNHFTFSCFNYVIQKLEHRYEIQLLDKFKENKRIQVPSSPWNVRERNCMWWRDLLNVEVLEGDYVTYQVKWGGDLDTIRLTGYGTVEFRKHVYPLCFSCSLCDLDFLVSVVLSFSVQRSLKSTLCSSAKRETLNISLEYTTTHSYNILTNIGTTKS